LEETVEAYCIECAAQKAQKETKTKIRKEAEKRRIVEKKKKKKKRLEYLQQLQDKILVENTALLESTKESKCKEVTLGNERKC